MSLSSHLSVSVNCKCAACVLFTLLEYFGLTALVKYRLIKRI